MKKLIIFFILLLASTSFADMTSDGRGHAEGVAGGLGSGGSGVTLTGATWTASGGSVSNAPTEGEELLTDGGLENWIADSPVNLTSWTELETVANLAKETSDVHGGAAALSVARTTAPGAIIQGTVSGTGVWHKTTLWSKNISGSSVGAIGHGYDQATQTFRFFPTASWAQYSGSTRSTASSGNGGNICYLRSVVDSTTYLIDDISVKPLTLSSLFLTAPLSTANVLASVKITKTGGNNGYQSGLVTNLDSASSPANFLIHYMDGAGNCKTDIAVAGVYTSLISAACTYSAGKELIAKKDGSEIRLFYNNSLVGTATLSAPQLAAVGSNLLHGLFSTGADSLDDLVLYATGAEGQYNLLNQFVQ